MPTFPYFIEVDENSRVIGTGTGNIDKADSIIGIDLVSYSTVNNKFLSHTIEYDRERSTLVYKPNLDIIKKNINAAINLKTTREIEEGFMFDGKRFGCSSYDQQNITRLYLTKDLYDSFWIKDSNHTDVELTKDGVVQFFKAMHDFIQSKLTQMNIYKKALDVLTDETDLEAFRQSFI